MQKKLWLIIMSMLLATFVVACGGDTAEDAVNDAVDAVQENAEEIQDTVEEVVDNAQDTVEEVVDDVMDDGAMAEVDFAVMPGGFLERALKGEFEGTEVIVDGAFRDTDTVRFEKSMEPFEAATGIDITYVGGAEFEGSIAIRVDAGDAPDIADFPQPGVMANFARQGNIISPLEWMDEGFLQDQYNQSWIDMTTVEGPDGNPMVAGLFHRFSGKSLVWYPKDDFEAAGYEIPTTWDELIALSDLIVSDGDSPWCIGIESGAATGWAATDWMEELMLRTTSLENYDAWTTGSLDFSSPEVKNAAEELAKIWFNDDYVLGGTSSIVSTSFGDAPAPMFEDPPRCWLHKQANFITTFFPEGVEAGVDYDFFYLPGLDEEYGKPFLVAGDIMSMMNDRPEVRAAMEYFATPQSAGGWLADGGALSAHQTVTTDMYGVELERGIAELVAEATSFRFDGSDLMPGEVGAGQFWVSMSNWVAGTIDLDTALAEIDESWPEGVEGQSSGGDDDGEMAEDDSMMSDAGFAVIAGGFLEQALNGDFEGTEVIVDGAFRDSDTVKFDQSMEAFEEATGIEVTYIGGAEFEGSIAIRVDAGDAPDIADFPQPGVMANFARQGKIISPLEWLDESDVAGAYNQSWIDMTTVEGPDGSDMMAGVFHRFSGKSLVWYPKDDFEAAGYEIPTTWDELIALSDLIASDGDTPWCIGIESGAATGWAATDWMEELMLRTTSLENYDAWTTGDLDFASPEVKNAAEELAKIWFNDDYVLGGTSSIVSTSFGDAPAPMFEDPPRCWLHKQANFITSFFPEGVEAGVDYDFFYLPGLDEEYGKPFLIAGDIMSMMNDRPEVRALMEYFMTPQSAGGWLASGGALAAHDSATPEMYGVDLERGIAELVAEATSFRFDGSDLMPGEVGAGQFWVSMSNWVAGTIDLDTALEEIDEAWPR